MEDFADVQLAIQVYLFAHEMQINSLVKVLDVFFTKVEASEIFAVFDMYKMMGNENALDTCKQVCAQYKIELINLTFKKKYLLQVVMKRTDEAFASDSWLSVSLDSVHEVLRMECLNVSEPEVVSALLSWGRAQLEADGEGDSGEFGEKLRNKIESCLKLIRLPALSHAQFTELCIQELGQVFSSKEKYRIMECITLGKWDAMPAQIAPSVCTRRSKATVTISVPTTEGNFLTHKTGNFSTQFDFQVDKNANFVGLLSLPPVNDQVFNANAFRNFTVTITETDSENEITSEYFINKREPLMFERACALEADVKYTITFLVHYKYDNLCYIPYNLNKAKNPVNSEWLKVTFDFKNFNFKIDEMIFEIPNKI